MSNYTKFLSTFIEQIRNLVKQNLIDLQLAPKWPSDKGIIDKFQITYSTKH